MSFGHASLYSMLFFLYGRTVTGVNQMAEYGCDKLLRAELVLARLQREAPIHLSIEEKCVLVKFVPGKNTLKDGLDEETLLFYDEYFAQNYFQTITKLIEP